MFDRLQPVLCAMCVFARSSLARKKTNKGKKPTTIYGIHLWHTNIYTFEYKTQKHHPHWDYLFKSVQIQFILNTFKITKNYEKKM